MKLVITLQSAAELNLFKSIDDMDLEGLKSVKDCPEGLLLAEQFWYFIPECVLDSSISIASEKQLTRHK